MVNYTPIEEQFRLLRGSACNLGMRHDAVYLGMVQAISTDAEAVQDVARGLERCVAGEIDHTKLPRVAVQAVAIRQLAHGQTAR